MLSKNNEARQCANTNRASMSVTACKETNMNIVAKSEYNFKGVQLSPVTNLEGVWFTSADLAKALEYSNSRAVTMIYNKYADEFSCGMSQVLDLSTSGNYRKKVRVFSLRGAHLIAMFARTDVAKEFRRWVLDILDREVAQGRIYPEFAFDMHAHNARVANEHIRHIYNVWRENLSPALRGVGSPIAQNLEDRFKAIGAITFGLANALSKQEKNGKIH
nr:Bro-N domain-containing protein [Salmonella enterica]